MLDVNAVVVVLQRRLVSGATTSCGGRDVRRRSARVVRAKKAEGEAERFAKYAPKATTESEVYDEVDGRIDDHQQLADGVEAKEIPREESVGEVPLGERDELEDELRRFADDEYDDDDDEHRRCVLVAAARWRCRGRRRLTAGGGVVPRMRVLLTCL